MFKRLRHALCLVGFGLLGWMIFVPNASAQTPSEIWEATTIAACQSLFGLVKPSSTEAVVDPPPTSTEVVVTDETVPDPSVTITPLHPRLEIISANPSEGDEWIELSGAGPDLVGWHLEDSVSRIYTFTSSSLASVDATSSRLRISLSVSRLNNGGDTVILKNSDTVVDQTDYEEVKKDQLWRRSLIDLERWEFDPPNEPPKPEPDPVETLHELSTPTTSNTQVVIARPAMSTAKPTQTKTVLATAKPKATPKTTTIKTVTKAATTASTPLPLSIDIPMTYKLESGVRVEVTGTVGSIPKLISSYGFVIHTPDGRGLIIHGTDRQPSPPMGATVKVTGTLIKNNSGIALRMYAKDAWKMETRQETVEPRPVELAAPDEEDAWSLVQVTGTVMGVDKTRVELDVDGVTVLAQIKPLLKYRAERLRKGDVVRLMGLLDTRGETPTVMPRVAEEIEVTQAAPLPKAQAGPTSSQLPAWTPFGAAGLTLAGAQGVKHIKKFREKRKLASLLSQAAKNLTQSTTNV